jgi:hypothetical protein
MEGENPPNRGEKRELVAHDDTESTPGWLRDFVDQDFNITFEPQIYTQIKKEYQPLLHDWAGFSFVHPPHAEAQLWVEKAIKESEKGNHSVLLLPAVFNACYWRDGLYQKATEIRVFTCPIKMPGKKKQIVSQMCLVIFAGRNEEEKDLPYPPIFPIEPGGWETHYYKRPRNRARFAKTL